MQRGGNLPADGIGQEVVEIVRPSDRRGAGREPVFQQQAGRHRERREFAQRRVRERIGGSRGRNAKRQLRVAQRRQPRRHRGDQERQDDGRAGLGHRLGHREEDSGADRRADTQHRQREDSERSLERLALGAVGHDRRFFRRLDAKQFPSERLDHAGAFSRRSFGNLPALSANLPAVWAANWKEVIGACGLETAPSRSVQCPWCGGAAGANRAVLAGSADGSNNGTVGTWRRPVAAPVRGRLRGLFAAPGPSVAALLADSVRRRWNGSCALAGKTCSRMRLARPPEAAVPASHASRSVRKRASRATLQCRAERATDRIICPHLRDDCSERARHGARRAAGRSRHLVRITGDHPPMRGRESAQTSFPYPQPQPPTHRN